MTFTDINDRLEDVLYFADLTNSDLTRTDAEELVKEVLDVFLVVEKRNLPEVKVLDTQIYSGNQSVSVNADPGETLTRALSYLAAAAKLTELKAEKEEARRKEEEKILSTINSLIPSTTMRRTVFSGLTDAEKLAAKEIIKLRDQLAFAKLAG
jgi:hypothetical protein